MSENAVTSPELVMAPEATVPASVTLAPLNVAATVVPDLIIKLPLVLVKLPKVVPPSFTKTSPPSASKIISPATSHVKSPDEQSISLPPLTSVKLSTTKPPAAVTAPVRVETPDTASVPVKDVPPDIVETVAVLS